MEPVSWKDQKHCAKCNGHLVFMLEKSGIEKDKGFGQSVKSNAEHVLAGSSCPVQCDKEETEDEKEMGMEALSHRNQTCVPGKTESRNSKTLPMTDGCYKMPKGQT